MPTRGRTLLVLAIGASALASRAQAQAVATTLPQCRSTPAPAQPPDADRRSARDFAARAQQATILADSASALKLYERAAELDPTDASTAYALGRSYESASDPRAVEQYCRFLLLAPNASEATDVRVRIAALAPVTAVAARGTSPGAAFLLSFVFPGLGQYSTKQPTLGVFVTAIVGGALYMGLQSTTKTTVDTLSAIDPNGNPYTYTQSHTASTHPNAAAGLGGAAAVILFSAIQAATHAANDSKVATVASMPRLSLSHGDLALGLNVPWR